MPRPLLYQYFADSADVLLAEYNRSKQQNASTNLGANRESFCNNFMGRVLPQKLVVRRGGEIIDGEGNKTGQLDTVILRDDVPILSFGSADTYLVEGVFSVLEIKSKLDRSKLQEAGQTLGKVAIMQPNIKASITVGPVINRPLRILFSYESSKWDTLLDEINKRGWHELFDIISVLNRGVLIKKGNLISWEDNSSFSIIDGKAASLGYIYLYLTTYGLSFIGRGVDLSKYFNPVSRWQE